VYPVGHHIAIRDLFVKEEICKNDIIFIYNDNKVKKITALKTTKDKNLLLVCEKREKSCAIAVYRLEVLNFNNVQIISPKRKIFTNLYEQIISACFSIDGNYIACLAITYKNRERYLTGVLWDLKVFQTAKMNNYTVKILYYYKIRIYFSFIIHIKNIFSCFIINFMFFICFNYFLYK
jgi:hypothetical protein